jgi:hypothetical protein
VTQSTHSTEPAASPWPDAPDSAPGLLVAYAPFAIWSPHFETDLEIVQCHLDAGGEALLLSCSAALRTCEANVRHAPLTCVACQSRFRSGAGWLRGKLQQRPFLDLTTAEAAEVEALRRRAWTDLDEVKAFTIDGADIGLAAVSSVVSTTREPEPQPSLHAVALGDNLASAATVYYSLRRILGGLRPARFMVFNGRLAAVRPALRAAQQLGIPTIVHERAGYMDRYVATRNTYPHDLAAVKLDIERAWQSEPDPARREQIAASWYSERRGGVAQNWHSFTRAQAVDRLPAGFDPQKRNIAVFVSSEDEFVAIEEWQNPLFRNQNAFLRFLLERLGDDARVQVYVRLHPNLRGVDNTQTRELAALEAQFPRMIVIEAASSVSSYALVDAAGLVISCGSTIGIEASQSGKASVLVGRGMYEHLGACHRPESREELIQLVRAFVDGAEPGPPPTSVEGVVRFGVYNRLGGYAYRYFEPRGLFDARMHRNGRRDAIRPALAIRLAQAAQRLLSRLARHLRPLPTERLGPTPVQD